MTRKLLDGKEVEELENPIELKIITRCPQKYKLIDMETGQEYIGNLPEDTKWDWKEITNEAK